MMPNTRMRRGTALRGIALAAAALAALIAAWIAFRAVARSEVEPGRLAAYPPASSSQRNSQTSASDPPPALAALPTPVFDPRLPGDDLPPAGRSLFDFLIHREEGGSATVPFPFSALLRRLGDQLQLDEYGPGYRAVLIPLGRSLQRPAAAPEFFSYPRAVVASEGRAAPSSRMLLKDRIYLGYQEKADTIEVISYNEAAGRFEFQQVRDYRPGGTPTVRYSNRAMCVSCHQGGGPIFSRQVWDETNANPRVAALLDAHSKSFYGIKVDRGIDIPNAIDNAKLRANRFAATQLLWREGCSGERGAGSDQDSRRCRARLFAAALQYRLSGERQFERGGRFESEAAARIRATWRTRWPAGLALGNPDIPNRDPLAAIAGGMSFGGPGSNALSDETYEPSAASGRVRKVFSDPLGRPHGSTVSALLEIPTAFEPLALRDPLEVLTPTRSSIDGLVTGLAEFIADSDVRTLDRQLRRIGKRPAERIEAACEITDKQTDYPSESLQKTSRDGPFGRRVEFHCKAQSGDSDKPVLAGQLTIIGGMVVGGSLQSLRLPGQAPLNGFDIVPMPLASGGGSYRATLVPVGERIPGPGSRPDAGRRSLPAPAAGSYLGARGADGNTVARIELRWKPDDSAGAATIEVEKDFATVEAAIAQLVDRVGKESASGFDGFDDLPFRRARLMPALFETLGAPARPWCCLDASGMPPAETLPVSNRGRALPGNRKASTGAVGPPLTAASAAGARTIFEYCAACHDAPDQAPPNFLYGDDAQVAGNLNRCAERIYVRLAMWGVVPGRRAKTPMPPETALHGLDTDAVRWPKSGELLAAMAYARGLIEAHSGRTAELEALLANGYEALPACVSTGAP